MSLTLEKKANASSPKPWKPRPEQKLSVRFLLAQCNAGLFLDPGLGKTSITLKVFDKLRREGVASRALVIAPKRVCYQVWPQQVQEWNDFNHLKVVVLHGKNKEKALHEPADIYCINPDGLDWLLDGDRLSVIQPDVLVVDESSKFKHTNTKRFKKLKPWLPMFERRIILTGSPNPNGYLDLFGQIYILDLGGTLGQYITHYRLRYFYPTGFGGYTWVLKPGADKEIQEALKPLVLRLDADDYVKMPAVVPNIIRVELPEKARAVYDELEEELFTELEGGEVISAVSSGSAMQKCSQVANGALYHMQNVTAATDSGKRAWTVLHDAKIEALQDLVDELQGQQLLVAYEYQHDRERLLAAFGKDTPWVGGGTTPKRSQEIEDAWNAGLIPLLLAHPAAMGHGLNMQKSHAQNICWFNITWDYEMYDQFIRRLRRSGNKAARMFVHHIAARDTVDEAKLRALRGKGKTQKALLDALRSYRKARL